MPTTLAPEDGNYEREDDCFCPALPWLRGMPIVVPVERDMDGLVMRQLVELTN